MINYFFILLTSVLIISPAYKSNPSRLNRLKKKVEKACECKVYAYHYKKITASLLEKIDPQAIIISGQNTPWSRYKQEDIMFLEDIIRNFDRPILGICGGHQLIGLTFGANIDYIYNPPTKKSVKQRQQKSYRQCKRIRGVVSTEIVTDDKILESLNPANKYFAYHCEELKTLPEDFIWIMKSKKSPYYLIKHKSKEIYGTQFHPEYYKSGFQILKNFFKIVSKK
ncbi:gamma-glutamyl-gamma-aminobutyrate hydrolase family protein [bacterium]|nr:gamma-glutamyl-gamma-aminobutyrate hydrolase family protein [bacterium]